MPPSDARFSNRLEALGRAHGRAQKYKELATRFENRFAFFRLVATLAILAAAAAIFEKTSVAGRVQIGAAIVLLLVLAGTAHQRLKNRARKWNHLQTSYALALMRLKRDFKSIQQQFSPWHKKISESIPAAHPYATDLDIGSNVFTLLDSCSTQSGSAKLLENLVTAGTNPLNSTNRSLRHARIQTLAKLTPFLRRHEIIRMDTELIANYLRSLEQDAAPTFKFIFSRNRLSVLIAAIIFGCVAWATMLIPAIAQYMHNRNAENLYHSLILYAVVPALGAMLFRPVAEFGASIQQRTVMLELMLKTIHSLKKEPAFSEFTCLKSDALKSFQRLKLSLNLISARNNPVLWLALHVVLPYDSIACALLLFASRKISKALPTWEQEITEFDVLCALARFQWENPHCGMFESSNAPFSATGLGHPLLQPQSMVDNDFSFSIQNPMVLLTGSNMSGKSTFLRTIGINLLFFNMGAPVCAKAFSAPLMRILCAIRVDDSLADGMSYFYAEVKRLKTILDTLESNKREGLPSLFLVDEIFRGTNNRERFVGSWSILHTLLDSAAFGIVSTHDLALTELEARDPRMRNLHFREHVENSKLVFDYKIKNGPCPTTNALAIMAAEGLPVLTPEFKTEV